MSDDPFGQMLSQQSATPQERMGDTGGSNTASNDPFGDALAGKQSGATPPPATDTGPAPDWSEIPGMAASNLVPSGKQFLGNMAQAVMHPIESAENVGKVGLGYMEKAGRHAGLPSGQGYEKYADAVNQMVMDRYGGMDNFKRTLAHDPVGVLADASAALTGGEGLLGRAPGIIGDVAKAAGKVGSVIDPLNPIAIPAKAALKGAGAVTRQVMGVRTGAGPEAISRAAEAGFEGGNTAEAFRNNMRGHAPVEGVVDDAMGAIDNIVSSKNANYQLGMAQAGLNQPIAQSSLQRINHGITNALNVGNFRGWQYDQGAARANGDLREIVDHFFEPSNSNLHTVEGLDALKQAIGEYQRENIAPGSKASIVGNEYYNAVKRAIVGQAPEYARVMDTYGEAKNLLSQLQKTFSLPAEERRLNTDTALRKLQSIMRNNVNTNYGYRQTLAQHLRDNGAPNIETALAGQALNSASPRGLARISVDLGAEIATGLIGAFSGNIHLLLGALGAAGISAITASPRIAGETAYYAGRTGKPLSKVFNRPVARGLNQVGRLDNKMDAINIRPVDEGQSRGGAIGRAKRLAMRKH